MELCISDVEKYCFRSSCAACTALLVQETLAETGCVAFNESALGLGSNTAPDNENTVCAF